MRIVVQIPCLNEEATLPEVIADIRAATTEFDDVAILIVDDGSTDRTVEVARASGADYIARHDRNEGLARAYMTGLAAALDLGADVIVNTDADNQYKAENIPALVRPVIARQADIVVGTRNIRGIEHFSPLKKRLQAIGTGVVRKLSKTEVRDATSGFRAVSREAAVRLNTFSDFTYTLETLIQAGHSGLRVEGVDIDVNPPTRPSRLFRGIPEYVARNAVALTRVFTIYAPRRSFFLLGSIPLGFATLLGLRYLFLIAFVDATRSHAPSLILAAVLAILGFACFGLGLLGDLLSINRRLLEELRAEQRRQAAANGRVPAQRSYSLIDVAAENGKLRSAG